MSAADSPAALAGRTGTPPVPWLGVASLWLLLPLLGVGVLGWAGFLIIGLLARRAAWLSAGGLYLVALLISLFMNEEAGPTARLLLWAISSLHALGINQAWLRNRWNQASRSSGSAWTALVRRTPAGTGMDSTTAAPTAAAMFRRRPRTAAPLAGAAPAPAGAAADLRPVGAAADLLNDPGLDAASYYAETGRPGAGASSALPAEPVDVNTAPAAALQKLPGISRHKARKAVRLRQERGPFRTVADFAAALDVREPELARLNRLVVCKLPPATPVPFGRSVDY